MTLVRVPDPRPSGDNQPPVYSPDGPILVEALQDQLGLKLETRKAPIGIIVVDHLERVPTEN